MEDVHTNVRRNTLHHLPIEETRTHSSDTVRVGKDREKDSAAIWYNSTTRCIVSLTFGVSLYRERKRAFGCGNAVGVTASSRSSG
jgi:hypothetical protein